jgi:hypothetical protein
MTCQICGKDDGMILTIGRFSWCRDHIHEALVKGEDALRAKYGSPDFATHGERERAKREAARATAWTDFGGDKW